MSRVRRRSVLNGGEERAVAQGETVVSHLVEPSDSKFVWSECEPVKRPESCPAGLDKVFKVVVVSLEVEVKLMASGVLVVGDRDDRGRNRRVQNCAVDDPGNPLNRQRSVGSTTGNNSWLSGQM